MIIMMKCSLTKTDMERNVKNMVDSEEGRRGRMVSGKDGEDRREKRER